MFSKEGKAKDATTPRICDVVWHDGQFINWNDARVHVMSHVLHYGSSIFEGHTLLCNQKRTGDLPFEGTHAEVFEFSENLSNGP
jgi:hypothetical protein